MLFAICYLPSGSRSESDFSDFVVNLRGFRQLGPQPLHDARDRYNADRVHRAFVSARVRARWRPAPPRRHHPRGAPRLTPGPVHNPRCRDESHAGVHEPRLPEAREAHRAPRRRARLRRGARPSDPDQPREGSDPPRLRRGRSLHARR